MLGEEGDYQTTLEDRIIYFCNKVNWGEVPLGPERGKDATEFYLRVGDESKSVHGLPDLPAQYQEYFLTKPIVGKITHIIDGYDAVFNIDNPAASVEGGGGTVTIDVGSADGVKKGLWFTDNKGDDFSHRFIVSSI